MKKVVGLLLCFAMIFFAGLTFVACTNPDEGTGEKYTITINLKNEGGTLTSSHNSATAGTEVTFKANPQTGYKIHYITVYYKSSGTYEDYYDMWITNNKQTIKMPASDIVVDVYFAQDLHDIDIRQTYNGQIVCRKEQAMEGERITVSFVPNEGYELNSATVFGGGLDIKVEAGSSSVSFEMPDGDVSIYATFKPKTYDLSVIGSTENGTIEAPETKKYKSTVTLNIKPNEGYEIENIVVIVMDGSVPVPVTIDGKTATFKMPAGNVTISATFRMASYEITTEETVNGAFQVDKETANFGDKVTITFYPEPGYEVSYVNVETISGTIKTIEVTGEGNTRTFIMPAGSVRISAGFEIGNYSVTVNASENGNVQASHSTAQYGDLITLTVNPNEYYLLSNISIICNGEEVARQDSGSTITFTMPAGNVTISATFAQNGNSITISDLTNGNLIVNPIIAQEDESVQITIQPDAGYELETITVMFGNVPVALTGEGNTRTFIMPAGDVTVSATFSKISYTISKNPTENGSFEVVENATFGDQITITINPNEGYEVDTITVMNGIKKVTVSGEGNTRTFTMPIGNVTISVTFSKISYTISKNPTENGSFEISKETATIGDEITITINPNEGYEVDTITVMNGSVEVTVSGEGNTRTFTMPAGNVTISATFSKISYTISKNPTENGSFEISEETATFGETITITITPNEGYQVNIVTVKKGSQTVSISGSGNTRTFTMPAGNVTVSVTFSKISYTISKNPTENGSLNVVTSGTINDEITITINPNEGYELNTITVMNGNEEVTVSGKGNTRTFTMPAGNVTVSATFSKISYTISKNPTENGSFEISDETATFGEIITITINPNNNYTLKNVKVMNGSKKVTVLGEGNTRTFTMPAGNVTVSVEFKLADFIINEEGQVEYAGSQDVTEIVIPENVFGTIVSDIPKNLPQSIKILTIPATILNISEGELATLTNLEKITLLGNLSSPCTLPTISGKYICEWNYKRNSVSTMKSSGTYEFSIIGYAEIPSVSDGWGYEIVDGKYEINKVPAGSGTLVIPNQLKSDAGDIIDIYSVKGNYISGWHPIENVQKYSKVIISKGIKEIGHDAFRDCTKLIEIIIPDSVTSIRNYAFVGCTNLKFKGYDGSALYLGSATNPYHFLINTDSMNIRGVIIHPDCKVIAGGAFANCTKLTEIAIPDSVTSIGDSAFYGCTSLTKIVIPDSVTSIGNSAFDRCTSLTKITIPDSVTSIGDSAFLLCTSLASVTLGNSVTSIGDFAFTDCDNLTEIVIPDSVTNIGDYAFLRCTRLSSVTLGNSVTSIGTGAFSGCRSLTEIVIPDSVTSIGSEAFKDCDTSEEITINGDIIDLGSDVFNCIYANLATLNIGANVTSLPENLFDSDNLANVKIINIDPANRSFTLELSEDGRRYDLKDKDGNILKSGIWGGSNITSNEVIE